MGRDGGGPIFVSSIITTAINNSWCFQSYTILSGMIYFTTGDQVPKLVTGQVDRQVQADNQTVGAQVDKTSTSVVGQPRGRGENMVRIYTVG